MAPKRARRRSKSTQGDEEEIGASVPHSQRAILEAASRADDDGTRTATDDRARSADEQSPFTANREDPDHVRIMLATDNHVGYMERDPVRGSDSINTFREILQLAKEHDVDFILLGGDLFHDNRPSRTTMHQVMGALREFTLGDKPVSIELLSDPNEGRAEGYSFPAVNYEDTNLNVAIPVFSIHGNHDDPQGVGPEGALSAVDLLSVTGLLNYFGKVELPTSDALARKGASQAPSKGGLSDVGIRIRPVLLRKGDTKIALYGMGNIKDERMHFELRTNRVRMYRPLEDRDDWFNILAIHQNRVAHDMKTTVPETMFDDSVHLVVWGHEHEQLIKPEPVVGKRYRITQPGSSVATSLCPGEAKEKQVAIIHVKERDFYIEPITLKTVRPFIMEEIDLDRVASDAGIGIDDKAGITKLLKGKVQDLIKRADAEWEEKHNPSATLNEDSPQKPLPLIRLRVHYTHHEMGNLVRFGQSFINKVANPRDLLQFAKKKTYANDRKNANLKENYVEPTDDMLPAEKLEKVSMSDLVQKYLSTQQLHILNPLGLERSVMKFVDKDDRDAIAHFVEKELKQTNSGLVINAPDEHTIDAQLQQIRTEKNRAADESREEHQEDEEYREDQEAEQTGGQAQTNKSASRAGGRGRDTVDPGSRRRHASLDDSIGSDDSMFGDIFPEPAVTQRSPARSSNATSTSRRGGARQPAARATPSGRRGGTQTRLTFRGNSEDEEEAEEQPPPPTLSARAAALAMPSPSKGASRGRGKKSAAPARSTTAGSSRQTGTRRSAAQRASARLTQGDDDDFESD